jgi:hypothetical protein
MAVVLDPRMRKLYAKMIDCKTVEDLEHFHEQLFFQYGEELVSLVVHEVAGADSSSQIP